MFINKIISVKTVLKMVTGPCKRKAAAKIMLESIIQVEEEETAQINVNLGYLCEEIDDRIVKK